MQDKQYVFGKKALIEKISEQKVLFVNFSSWNNEIITTLKEKNIPFKIHKDQKFFQKFSDNLNHQGIIAEIKQSNTISSVEDLIQEKKSQQKQIILVIDSIEDPQNFGAILRTCEAMGVDGIIYKKDNQVQVNDFVRKTSMGAVDNLNLIKVANISLALEKFKKSGYWTYSSTLSPDSSEVQSVKFDSKTILIVGNENKGISKIVQDNSDYKINIPMFGSIQSLNVSVATGIILFEIKKQHQN